jgi:4-hydroxythreonine-4-phosphate dehydrogenase
VAGSPSRIARIAVTCGEPAGIGPDLTAEIAAREWPHELVVIGDPGLVVERARAAGRRVTVEPFEPDAAPTPSGEGRIRCLPIPLAAPVVAGRLDPRNARHVLALLDAAGAGALDGRFDAIATGPVHKGVINDAGFRFTGHTEFFAAQAGTDVLMLLVTGTLRVALATTHLPLARVPAAITPPLLERALRLLDQGLRERFGISRPRIAVLGLNPHAGEDGHLGREDVEVIAPVTRRLLSEGLDLEGPIAADTAFVPQRRARHDAFLAMFHDQGLPVLKALGFGDAVNVTLGLPYVRTSVDHGTALDVAGSGRADVSSFVAAIELAGRLAHREA